MGLSLRLKATPEFISWCDSLTLDLRRRVHARIDNIRVGIFANSRSLGDGLFELKWKIGMRVYFSRKRVAGIDVIVLWGGFKGTQPSDIVHARKLKHRYEKELEEDAR